MTTSTPAVSAVRSSPARAKGLAAGLADVVRLLASGIVLALSAWNPAFVTVLWASTERLDTVTAIHQVAAADDHGNRTADPRLAQRRRWPGGEE